MAPSEVQGYGLFAGQDLKEDDFVHEYRGEIISDAESDRRGALYHLAGLEYLFTLNTEQQVDANSLGNKARFMNNSLKEANINVQGRIMLCSGQHRIGLFAKKDIEAGEELLWDYGYPEVVTEQFWERGEKSAKLKAATPRMPAAARTRKVRTPKTVKASETRRSAEDSSQSPLARRGGKRKKGGLQSSSSRASLRDEDVEFDPMMVDETALNLNDQAEQQDSDYNDEGSDEEEDEPDEEIADSDVEEEVVKDSHIGPSTGKPWEGLKKGRSRRKGQ
ncbi:Histone-lysine N-methyltransferase EZH2 [Cyphellophora attinorum]|uniref:Histone-lysine N-methyltransferase EZH2 n=1 Tax=Cyphellophora attinorum TaxID=1664694 RepID=A0A0N1P0X9_9EURO|nr:Histone-lysine N-methyltransferase EZH2 [Phialophora attinorum]KPI39702.1 Histone-lysine N-methyltransferase EZH2 [Phialophora attinorum]